MSALWSTRGDRRLRSDTRLDRDRLRRIVDMAHGPVDVWFAKHGGQSDRARVYPDGVSRLGNRPKSRTRVPLVIVRVSERPRYPATLFPGTTAHVAADVDDVYEEVVFLLAHELRHLWWAAGAGWTQQGFDRATVARLPVRRRNRIEEQDCDLYAMAQLRAWRVRDG